MLAALIAHLATTANETNGGNGSRPLARRRRLRIYGPPDGAKLLPEHNLTKMHAMFSHVPHGQVGLAPHKPR